MINCSDYGFDEGWSYSQCRFLFEVRKLMCCTRTSHRVLAEGAGISKDAVTRLLKGQHKRGPHEPTLQQIYVFARSAIDGDLGVIDWEVLRQLRQDSASEREGSASSAGRQSAVACPECGTSVPEVLAIPADPEPAASDVVVGGVVPVPLTNGDRHHDPTPAIDIAWTGGAPYWQPATELAGYIAAGQLENSSRLIHYVATEAGPDEAANAVIACRDLELRDAVDAIINYAGRRVHYDVLQILRPLLQNDRHGDAAALVNRALDAAPGDQAFGAAAG